MLIPFGKIVKIQIPGILNSQKEPYFIKNVAFPETNGQLWLEQFRTDILEAMKKKKWLPVYRMADGEFSFCVGWAPGKSKSMRDLIKKVLFYLKLYDPTKKPTMWSESYTDAERKLVEKSFPQKIKRISEHGYLAVYFDEGEKGLFNQYYSRMLNWFERNEITLTKYNYIPFLFVLASLVGEKWQDFIEHRNILIVTSLNEEKKRILRERILELGAKSITTYSISKNKSMLQKIELERLHGINADIAFVAAGIGSANILCQLEPLDIPVLDVGGFVNALIDPGFIPHGYFDVKLMKKI